MAAIRVNNSVLIDLSVQQLVDCNRRNNGCKGGFAFKAFEYMVKNGGLASDSSYPYQGRQGTCSAAAKSPAVVMNGPSFDIALMFQVKIRPVVVAVDANNTAFIRYPGGVYRGPCGHNLNHEMLLVGYGTTCNASDDLDYWIVKNSYGEGWGENGYIRMHRNRDTDDIYGICGILMDVAYPDLDFIIILSAVAEQQHRYKSLGSRRPSQDE